MTCLDWTLPISPASLYIHRSRRLFALLPISNILDVYLPNSPARWVHVFLFFFSSSLLPRDYQTKVHSVSAKRTASCRVDFHLIPVCCAVLSVARVSLLNSSLQSHLTIRIFNSSNCVTSKSIEVHLATLHRRQRSIQTTSIWNDKNSTHYITCLIDLARASFVYPVNRLNHLSNSRQLHSYHD
jgi:hypothetical protein